MVGSRGARAASNERRRSEEGARKMRGAFSVACRGRVGRAGLQAGWAGSSLRRCLGFRFGAALFFGFAFASLSVVVVVAGGVALAPLWVASLCRHRLRLRRKSSALGNSRKKSATTSAPSTGQRPQGRASPASLQPSPTDPTTAGNGKRAPHLLRSFLAPSSLVARSAGCHG